MNNKIETSVPLSVDIVQKAIEYMEEHILEELTPKLIASELYISISTLNVLFKTICELTVMEYIRNRRLSLAGQELLQNNLPVIELAYKYGYETPEAFTKAFTRCYGFPPSVIRRIRPSLTEFQPIQISMRLLGGWEQEENLPKVYSVEQEIKDVNWDDDSIKYQGGINMMETEKITDLVSEVRYHINTENMKEKEDWKTLLALANELDKKQIKFKVDGKTMIFAHGLEFPLEKICLTFRWSEDEKIMNFFDYEGKGIQSCTKLKKYFDTKFRGMKVRCMFYDDIPEDGTYNPLFLNAEPVDIDGHIVMVQTLEFYYANAEKGTEYYKMVGDWIKGDLLKCRKELE